MKILQHLECLDIDNAIATIEARITEFSSRPKSETYLTFLKELHIRSVFPIHLLVMHDTFMQQRQRYQIGFDTLQTLFSTQSEQVQTKNVSSAECQRIKELLQDTFTQKTAILRREKIQKSDLHVRLLAEVATLERSGKSDNEIKIEFLQFANTLYTDLATQGVDEKDLSHLQAFIHQYMASPSYTLTQTKSIPPQTYAHPSLAASFAAQAGNFHAYAALQGPPPSQLTSTDKQQYPSNTQAKASTATNARVKSQYPATAAELEKYSAATPHSGLSSAYDMSSPTHVQNVSSLSAFPYHPQYQPSAPPATPVSQSIQRFFAPLPIPTALINLMDSDEALEKYNSAPVPVDKPMPFTTQPQPESSQPLSAEASKKMDKKLASRLEKLKQPYDQDHACDHAPKSSVRVPT